MQATLPLDFPLPSAAINQRGQSLDPVGHRGASGFIEVTRSPPHPSHPIRLQRRGWSRENGWPDSDGSVATLPPCRVCWCPAAGGQTNDTTHREVVCRARSPASWQANGRREEGDTNTSTCVCVRMLRAIVHRRETESKPLWSIRLPCSAPSPNVVVAAHPQANMYVHTYMPVVGSPIEAN